jgi:carnitine-CoA ligase
MTTGPSVLSVPLTYGGFDPHDADPQRWTLSRVLESRVQSHGDKEFLRMPGSRSVTFRQAEDEARRIAGSWKAHGLEKGDRLVIMGASSVDYVVAWFATACLGLVEVPISPYYRGEGLRRLVTKVAPAAVCCDPALVDEFIDSRAVQGTERVYLFDGPGRDAAAQRLADEGVQLVENFENLVVGERLEGHPREYHELASVLFTSGTTGLPKGVRMPEAQLYFFSNQFLSYENLTEHDVYLHDKPMYTSLAHFHVVYACLIAAAQVVMYDRFSATLWVDRVRASGATTVVLIGEMMDFVYKQPRTANDHLPLLRCVSCGPTSWAVVHDFRSRFGGQVIAEAYGQTEISVPLMTPYGAERPEGACGLLVDDWFEVRLADSETDEEVPVGSVGEMQLRTRQSWTMCDGYYEEPAATADARRNLWFHTGDLFRRDDEGWYYFIDRARDVIRRRGQFISSREIEEVFLSHRAVLAVAAVSLPPAEPGESDEVLAAIVVDDDAPSNEDLIQHVARHLPYYSIPRFVRRMIDLPVTPTGKVRKVEIRSAGVTDEVWDRRTSGVVLDQEASVAQTRRNRAF